MNKQENSYTNNTRAEKKSIRAPGPVVLKLGFGSVQPAGFSGDPAKGGGAPGKPEQLHCQLLYTWTST